MVQGLLADVNCEGHVRLLVDLMRRDWRREIWDELGISVSTFADYGLRPKETDRQIWRHCQQNQLILITANRNEYGADSLQATIQELNTSDCFPVITIANTDRLTSARAYARKTADKLLDNLLDMGNLRGTGRLYIP